MRIRVIATVFSSFVTVVTAGCLELSATNGSGGAGNAATSGTGTTSSSGSTSSSSGGGAGAGGASASSSSGAPNKCSEPNLTCLDCETCHGSTMGGTCASLYLACQGNANCVEVVSCLHGCPSMDVGCFNDCWALINAMGEQVFTDYFVCMYCGVCVESCATTIPCAG